MNEDKIFLGEMVKHVILTWLIILIFITSPIWIWFYFLYWIIKYFIKGKRG